MRKSPCRRTEILVLVWVYWKLRSPLPKTPQTNIKFSFYKATTLVVLACFFLAQINTDFSLPWAFLRLGWTVLAVVELRNQTVLPWTSAQEGAQVSSLPPPLLHFLCKPHHKQRTQDKKIFKSLCLLSYISLLVDFHPTTSLFFNPNSHDTFLFHGS